MKSINKLYDGKGKVITGVELTVNGDGIYNSKTRTS